MFEIDAAHVASMLPCPECGRMLENYDPDAPDDDSTQALSIPGGGAATTMLRVPDSRRRHFDVPTQAVAIDALGGSVDVPPPDPSVEIPTQAYRSPPVDEDAPTKALNANALRKAITDGMLDEAPTKALDAHALRAGAAALRDADEDSTRAWTKPITDSFGEDAPTRALRMADADVLTSAAPVGVSGPVPGARPAADPGPLRGVSGPLPKPRPRKPKPAPARPPARALAAPPPARPLDRPPPARPLDRPSSVQSPAPPPAAPPPARPAPVAAPVAPVAQPALPQPALPQPVPQAAPAAPAIPATPAPAGPALPPPPEPVSDEAQSYFDQSRAIDLPDALGALLNAGPEPASPKDRPTAQPTRKKSKRTLLIIVSVFVLLIAGAIVLVVTRDTDPGKALANAQDDTTPASEAADDGAESQKAFNRALTRNKARLPAVTQGEALEDGDFIIAGPDGIATHHGPVVGLMSTPFPDSSLSVEPTGEEAKPLLGAFRGGGDKPLYAAIDRRVKARTVAQIVNSAKRSGYSQINLVGRRGGDSGELIALPVKPFVPGTPPPSAGGVELRIGQLGMNVVVKGRDGRLMGERPAPIPRAANTFDFNALDDLLDRLSSAHPMVRSVVVYTNGDLGMEILMGVLGRVRGSDTRDRFPAISLSVK